MKINHKILWVLSGFLSLVIILGACSKPDALVNKKEGTIYMPQAYSTKGNLSLVLLDSAQKVGFGAAYGGLKYPSQDVTVNFKIDTTIIAAYNLQYGTSYVPFPAASYTSSTLSSLLTSGKTRSSTFYTSLFS